jgi:hypothetical protein
LALASTDQGEDAAGKSAAGSERGAATGSGAGRDEGSNGALIIAAVLLGLAIVLSALAVRTAVDRNTSLIAGALRNKHFKPLLFLQLQYVPTLYLSHRLHLYQKIRPVNRLC